MSLASRYVNCADSDGIIMYLKEITSPILADLNVTVILLAATL